MRLELYYRPGCPESEKIRRFIHVNGLRARIDYYDVAVDETAQYDLVTVTGTSEVPCLVINGRPLADSNDIVGWLARHLVEEAGDAA